MCIRICSNVEDYKNKKLVQLLIVWYLITKSCSRWQLGLPTSSAVVHLWKTMLCTMFQSIQTLCKQQIYWTFPQADFLFYIFMCSVYHKRSWTPSVWLCLCANSRWCCMHFLYRWHKIRNVSHQLTDTNLQKAVWTMVVLQCQWISYCSMKL